MEKKERNAINEKKYAIGALLFSLLIIIPVIIYAGFSMPAADDFSNAVYVSTCKGGSSFAYTALTCTIASYYEIGGYFFSAFLNYFFSPFLRTGIAGLRIFNALVNILFFTSLFCFIRSFSVKIARSSKTVAIIIYSMLVFIIVNGHSNSEVYTWYCVLVGYVLPISVMLFSLSILIDCVTSKRESKLYIPASVLAFLASGSSLNVAALNCGLFFLIGAYALLCLGKKKEPIVAFSCALGGAIINVVAPGNYARHSAYSAENNVLKAISIATKHTVHGMKERVQYSPYLAILLFMLVLCLVYIDFSGRDEKYLNPFIAGIVLLLGIMIVNFPVALGYLTAEFPDRCVFVQDITFYILSYMWIYNFAGWLKTNCKDFIFTPANGVCIGVCIMITLVFALCNYSLSEYATAKMYKSISNRKLMEYVDYEEGILNEIEQSDESDVVIKRKKRKDIPFFKSLGITGDPDFWVDFYIGKYYGKNKLTVIYEK